MTLKSNPQDMLNRWKAGVAAAGPRYTAGIAQSADWAAAATAPAAVQARNAGLQAAMANGSIERGIAALGTNNWRSITQAKSANWQQGVNSQVAGQRALAGFNKLFGFLQQAESAVSGMPRGGYAENRQRMLTYIDEVHNAAMAAKG